MRWMGWPNRPGGLRGLTRALGAASAALSSESSSESSSERTASLTSLAAVSRGGKPGKSRVFAAAHNSASTKGILCDE